MDRKEENPHLSRWQRLKKWLSGLSFRTGLIVLGCCVAFYVISFAQMLLPIGVTTKGVLWIVFFGLAKTAQYTAIAILGKVGIQKIRETLKKKK